MKNIFEQLADLLIEALPAIFIITILLFLYNSGMLGEWLGKMATWMFG